MKDLCGHVRSLVLLLFLLLSFILDSLSLLRQLLPDRPEECLSENPSLLPDLPRDPAVMVHLAEEIDWQDRSYFLSKRTQLLISRGFLCENIYSHGCDILAINNCK